MVIAYWTIFGLTFAFVLSAFLRDDSATKSNLNAWLFVVIAALLWPITLPSIINSKLRTNKHRARSKAGFSSSLNTAPAADS